MQIFISPMLPRSIPYIWMVSMVIWRMDWNRITGTDFLHLNHTTIVTNTIVHQHILGLVIFWLLYNYLNEKCYSAGTMTNSSYKNVVITDSDVTGRKFVQKRCYYWFVWTYWFFDVYRNEIKKIPLTIPSYTYWYNYYTYVNFNLTKIFEIPIMIILQKLYNKLNFLVSKKP